MQGNVGSGDADAPSLEVTRLMRDYAGRPRELRDKLFPLLYASMKEMARRQLRSEYSQQHLQPTELVNEAYFRLAGTPQWANRAHFLASAAQAMRQVLVDAGRKRRAQKRAIRTEPAVLDELSSGRTVSLEDVLAVDEGLHQLKLLDPVKAELLELKFFGGLSTEEAASVLGLGLTTTKQHLKLAKAWMHARLKATAAAETAQKKVPTKNPRTTH